MGFPTHHVICVLNEVQHLACKFTHACYMSYEATALDHLIYAFTCLCRGDPAIVQRFQISRNLQFPTLPKSLNSIILPYAILIHQFIPCRLKLCRCQWVIDYNEKFYLQTIMNLVQFFQLCFILLQHVPTAQPILCFLEHLLDRPKGNVVYICQVRSFFYFILYILVPYDKHGYR
ncbi:hypothetical protein SEVIR_7G023315v4 [Setaria viridis]|uniref:Uncharacterized protein n=1 Tax=Setaria viridis TaxID=4556 RepID=A0A4V6D3P5_SETVI|nr:hypothetical protein SEVIR_7G023315v2 [Setaria viridis]